MSSPELPTNRHFVTQLFNSLPTIPQPPPPDHAVATEPNNPLSSVPDTVKKQLLSLQVLFPNEFVPALDLLDRRLVTRFRISDGLESVADGGKEAAAAAAELDNGNEDVQMRGVDGEEEAIQTKDAELKTHSTINIAVDDTSAQQMTTPQSPIPLTDTTIPESNSTTTSSNAKAAPVYYVRSAQQPRSSRYSTSYDTTTSYQVRLQAWNCSCPAFAFSAFPATQYESRVPVYNDTADKDGNEETIHKGKGENTDAWSFGGVSLGEEMPPVCKHLLACVLAEKCLGLFGRFVEEKEVSIEEAAAWAAGWGD